MNCKNRKVPSNFFADKVFSVALVSYKVTIIYEINDPSAKYENLEKKLKIRRFGLIPLSSMVAWNGMNLKKAGIRSNDAIGGSEETSCTRK